MTSTRLRGAIAAAAVAVLALGACSTGSAGSTDEAATAPAAADAFPVTITHAFGETTIAKQPQRVATVAWVNADTALALGVVPVGMPKDEWGGNDKGSTPWKDAALDKLGAAIGTAKAPAQYSEADGINFAEIAKTTPDVILAAYSGLTKADYDKLSKIAPVVAYPDVAWGTPWQQSTAMIGKALGKSAQAEKLVADTEQTIKDKAAAYPQLAGKTFIYGNLEPDSGAGINIYTPNDNRPRFLTEIGMKLAPVIEDKTKGGKEFFIEWSPERASELASDVFVTWVPDAKTKAAITKDPLIGQIPAVKSGALVADSDNTLTLSISASNPLSLPWALDKVLPQLGAAADTAS
ncbi:iron-siderophore ABC transporter substrate-binding protein [Angustibacter luteus]|uniref:Iron-siderophore ABC transporter substrate-binding protein n=1 Tax=Angustibacter luteus TaxID=658456 RepID=A0ABW1JIL0_9ACTN